jgi:MFS transporter, DHA1 family, multidrug resistance protein B
MSVPIRQALLGDIAPDHARSTYLAINNLTYFGSGIIGSAFITSLFGRPP